MMLVARLKLGARTLSSVVNPIILNTASRTAQLACSTSSNAPTWLLAPCVVSAAVLAQGQVQCEESKEYTQLGEWRQDSANSDSLGPFLRGLGVPRFAVIFVDAIKTDLNISCHGDELTVRDHTLFGKNATVVTLGAAEVEKTTKSGRKKFMLSGFVDSEGRLTVQCRLFQRGDGWFTLQSWAVREDGALEERMVLQRPGEEDVVVNRIFRSMGGAKQHHSGTSEAGTGEVSTCARGKYAGVGAVALAVGGASLVFWKICGAQS